MSARPDPPCRNGLINALAPDDRAAILPHLERVSLDEGHVIVAKGAEITFVCFPECGVTSIADVLEDGTRVEIGLIGRDGMTNSQLLLGCRRAPFEAIVQIGGGSSLLLKADRLRDFCARSRSAQALFLRFVHVLSVQTARTLTSNLRDTAERRLARWLLMCHDRVDGDEIRLIHEHLGRMLGVRRATVTDALHLLEGRGAIRGQRGRILVRDREMLESLAGESYGFPEDYYRRLIGPVGKGRSRGRAAAAATGLAPLEAA